MMNSGLNSPFPVLGIAAWSGTGKTTLLTHVIPRLREAGLNVGVIKHAHHSFDVDQPGKDSYRLRQAGAIPMVVASHQRLALVQETPGREEPDLYYLLSLIAASQPDLVIVEGFKQWPIPKLVLYREGIGEASILHDKWVQAVAMSGVMPAGQDSEMQRLELDDIEAITQWILEWVKSHPSSANL